jgi:hypothetical protein
MAQLDKDHPVYRALLGRFMEVAVRTEANPTGLLPELRKTILQTNPHLAIGESTTMADAVEDSIGAQRLAGTSDRRIRRTRLTHTIIGLYGIAEFLRSSEDAGDWHSHGAGADRTTL